MLKKYIVNGKKYLYEEGEQPAGAVEAKAKEEVQDKAKKPANKARRAKTK